MSATVTTTVVMAVVPSIHADIALSLQTWRRREDKCVGIKDRHY